MLIASWLAELSRTNQPTHISLFHLYFSIECNGKKEEYAARLKNVAKLMDRPM